MPSWPKRLPVGRIVGQFTLACTMTESDESSQKVRMVSSLHGILTDPHKQTNVVHLLASSHARIACRLAAAAACCCRP